MGPNPDNSELISVLQELVQACNAGVQALKEVFPRAIGTESSAVAGAATLPANPVAFIETSHPITGATILIPYYDPP